MFRLTVFLTLVLALVGITPQAVPAAGPDGITVMTRNLYFGASFAPIFEATDLPSLIAAASQVFATVQASRPADRMAAIADEIARKRPDLVGLQEVTLWRSGPPTPAPATTVEFDFLQLLIDALAARGHEYVVVTSTQNFDSQVVALVGGVPRAIRYTDLDVILARADAGLSFDNVVEANYAATLTVPTFLGPFTIPRGYGSVDVTRGSHTFRFVNTHLEGISPIVQGLQALEILNGVGDTTLPLVLACDCNTAATSGAPDSTPTYAMFLAAGLVDSWAVKHPGKGATGFTCCQDSDLRNLPSVAFERIDFVFFRGAFDVRHAWIVGAHPGDRTPKNPDRLWPSDHAGMVMTLDFQ